MSTLKEALSTPTTRMGKDRSADSYVFSSPARDVGWSPSTAITPLGAMFYDNNSNAAYLNQIIESNVSPIRRTSRFPLSNAETMLLGITRTPTAKFESGARQFTSEDREACEPSKEARLSRPLPPPSTPEPTKRLFQTLFSKNITDPYPYGEVESEGGYPRSTNRDGAPSGTGRNWESNITDPSFELIYSSSPNSPPRHTTHDSPIKPRRAPMFPLPANLPPFVIHPSIPAHTFGDPISEGVARSNNPRAKRAPLPIGALSPPSMCYPSAEPLDDDPFLVRASIPAEGRLGGSGLTGALDSTGAMPSAAITPPDDSTGANAGRLSRRHRAPRGRVGGRAKNPMPKPKATHHKSAGALDSESSLLIPSSPPRFSVPPPKFSLSLPLTNTELQTQPSGEISTLGQISNDQDPATPSTQLHPFDTRAPPSSMRFSQSHANPSTMARTLFPTPSLASSFGTPSTASLLTTPAHALFPSPDITDSPTMMRPTRGWGRVTRSGLRTRYAMPAPMVERDLIGGSKLAESTPDHQIGRYNPTEGEWSSVVQASEPGVSGSPGGHRGDVQTSAGDDDAHKGTGRGEDVESFQVTSSDPMTEQPATSLVSSGTSDEPEKPFPVISTPETPTYSSAVDPAPLVTGLGDSVHKSPQLKRAREESDEDEVPTATKRVKVVDKDNASASPSKAGGPTETDIFQTDFGFGRTTRAQARAVAALLALASSGDNQNTSKNQKGGVGKGNSQSKTEKTKTPVTGRPNTRSQGKPQDNDAPTQTPSRSQRASDGAKRGVVGRAPSRAVDTPSNNVPKIRSTTSTRTRPLRSIVAKQRFLKVQPQGAKTEAGNGDHVSATHQVPSEFLPRPDSSVVYGSNGKVIRRTFPEGLPIHEACPDWYRRFPVSAYFMKDDPVRQFVLGDEAAGIAAIPASGLVPQPAPYFNLYTPRFMRGIGAKKFGLCPICVEPVWRGGKGQKVSLNTKISQYNYHMQYYHGLSAQTGLPFSPPIAFRQKKRQRVEVSEREVIEEGKCHVCKKWVPIETVKPLKIMVPEIFWWKHAASCHGASRLAGDKNPYIEDNVYLKLREYEGQLNEDQALTEEPGSQEEALEPHSPDATGPRDMENQEYSMDSDSDLTDLDAEAEDVDINTSDLD